MPYIGNDVVNLSDSQARAKSGNIRFLNRVFTQNEQDLICRSIDPDLAVWSLWAAKESAYKAISKKRIGITSSPRKYEIKLDSSPRHGFLTGAAITPAEPVFFNLFSGTDFVHCVAAESRTTLNLILWGMERSDTGCYQRGAFHGFQDESATARMAAVSAIAAYLGVKPEDVNIRRDRHSGSLCPPVAYLKGERIKGDLSLSHDLPFIAYAFMPEIGIVPAGGGNNHPSLARLGFQ